MTNEQLAAYDTPAEKRSEEQNKLAFEAEERMRVTHEDVARQIKGPQHAKAKQLAEDATEHEKMATYIGRYRDTVNFLFWRLRTQVEQTDEALNARKFIYQGNQAFRDGDPTTARNAYDQGFVMWRQVLDKFPALFEDEITGSDLMDFVKQYERILKQLDEPFPEKFPLQNVIDRYGKRPGLGD